ncbi:uncharacterized protein EI90DRAFT_3131647 [Cantharellus anzutake]|uniref:uncharacterized protein n=1 Tax=Cantharellus anzutake TaxID=1750568 RepID=UPI00190779EA|nr:uncharacterized protein EI90DRAFT_3131647 [Cantharellus anzutake]KAF8321408.1 hypothetical protein EI90DRAFT_3131647 [Cantharellus anzutake]
MFGHGVSMVLFNATVPNSTLYKALKSAAEHGELPQGFSRSYFKRAFSIDKGIFDANRMLDYEYDNTVPQPDETLAFGTVFRKYWRLLPPFIVLDVVVATRVSIELDKGDGALRAVGFSARVEKTGGSDVGF